MFTPTSQQPSTAAAGAVVDELLGLRDPLHPTRRLPGLVRRLLPNPLASYEQWQRFAGEDVTTMSAVERAWEVHRLRVAAALVDDDARLPAWLLGRLQRLAS